MKIGIFGKLDNLGKTIKFILSVTKEDAKSVLNEHQKNYLTSKFFNVQKLGLNKPGSVEHYVKTALIMKLNEDTFSDEELVKFSELQIRHSKLFTFIELVKSGETELSELFESIFDLCPEGKEIKKLKQKAYEFLDETYSVESTSTSYFTRSSYSNKILESIDIPKHQLVQILFDYQKYINNTEWRKYIKEKRKEQEELERKRNIKKTFVQWLQA
jgi:hypothetical protein